MLMVWINISVSPEEERKVRCFLVNTEGYLVAHPSLLKPTRSLGPSVNIPPHITHQVGERKCLWINLWDGDKSIVDYI